MTQNEVKRLAVAIAKANGHDDHDGYAEKVVEAWKDVGHPDAPKADAEEEV